jgi:riboflavin kinase/FMN adenylyltransferase
VRFIEARDIHSPTVVTIGNFDGIHRGHQALIQRARAIAEREHLSMVVLTFEPHPAAVLRGTVDHFLISPGEQKYELLEQIHAPAVRVLSFTPEFARIPAEDFLNNILARELKVRWVVVGYNFTFGFKGLGNIALLDSWGREHGVHVAVVEPFRDASSDDVVSSSAIRALIARGDMDQARRFLGHPFTTAGVVQHGDQRGRELGAPTLNLSWPPDQVMPPYGVYAGWARLPSGKGRRMAAANFGVRPTFGDNPPLLEVHVLDGSIGELYGESVQFEFYQYLRPEIRFANMSDLAAAIQEDIANARHQLASLS